MENEKTEDFGGWDNTTEGDQINFFGEEQEIVSTKTEDVTAAVEKDNLEIDTKDSSEEVDKKKEEKVEEPTFSFEEDNKEEDKDEKETLSDEDKNEETKDEVVSTETSVSTVNYLKEKGLIDFELEEGAELTPEIAEEILEDSLDEKVDNKLKSLFSELPDVVKELNKFAMTGGDVNDFLSKVSPSTSLGITADLDLSIEANKELVIKNQLKTEGYDDDYINTQLEFLKDSKKLDSVAEKHFDKWKKSDEEKKNKIFEAQQLKIKTEKENRKKFKAEIKDLIEEADDFNGLKLSKKDKNELPSYMSDKNIKLDNGGSITQMERDLWTALRDKNKSVLIAKLLQNDFDFKDIQKSAETKVAKKVKDNIRRGKSTPAKSAKGSSQKNKNESLADFF